ncbi:hypothetical protein BCR32DRAFT_297129 [Anaeromyces robustus]|uniref:Uncharacterized protein n=1 Tax=Anaeromyces robustus TaxID=1754192 RepID=A0A1Y1WNE6_9FUNG|nr:hypothetical protein BCR32DRAFT_297129 [Anaeromyces robustus]|eukprot:ORX75080.1 hypothetical protein BCR32DRAFT_297129 [Anaeromyces robustus]
MMPINIDALVCILISVTGFLMYTITYILNCLEKPEYGHNHNVDRWQTWLVVDIALVCILMSVFTFFNKIENIKLMLSSFISITLAWIIRDGDYLIFANDCKYYVVMGCGLFVVATGLFLSLIVIQFEGPITQITGRNQKINNVNINNGLLV